MTQAINETYWTKNVVHPSPEGRKLDPDPIAFAPEGRRLSCALWAHDVIDGLWPSMIPIPAKAGIGMGEEMYPIDSFELEIKNKISPYPHYPAPIHNIGGLYLESRCRIPGVQPLTQTILRHTSSSNNSSFPGRRYCFDYGNARFPPKCNCDEKYDCVVTSGCQVSSQTGKCSLTCGSCNHNSNVIFY